MWLLLILAGLGGTGLSPTPGLAGPGLTTHGNYAFFEFAPNSGAGMTLPCACTTPTGAKGEAMTFTRASSGTCLKSNTTSGIANGDMATCSTNQPRVMPGGDGTGAQGLLVEASRTNSTIRSQELDNAAWLQQNNVSAPTVTADQAVAPDGTTTAERIQSPATSAAQFSFVYQSAGCAASSTVTGSFLVKGNGQSGTTDVVIYTGAGYFTAPCAFVSGSWSVCTKPNVATIAGITQFGIGNASSLNGGTARSAVDIFVWGAQCEDGAYATSYIATTSAAVTRAADNATVAVTDLTSSTESMAVTVVPGWSGTTGPAFGLAIGMKLSGGVTSFANLDAAGTSARFYDGVTVVSKALTAGTQRYIGWRSGTDINVSYAAQTSTTSNSPPADVMTGNVCVGSDCSGLPFDGVVKQLCLDPSPTRCR